MNTRMFSPHNPPLGPRRDSGYQGANDHIPRPGIRKCDLGHFVLVHLGEKQGLSFQFLDSNLDANFSIRI